MCALQCSFDEVLCLALGERSRSIAMLVIMMVHLLPLSVAADPNDADETRRAAAATSSGGNWSCEWKNICLTFVGKMPLQTQTRQIIHREWRWRGVNR